MFGSKKKEKSTKSNLIPSSSNTLNSIVQGTSFVGDIVADSDIRIDGTLKGTLECAAKVVVGPTGSIEGEIRCQNAVVEGRFKGDIYVEQLLQVKEKAEISGNINTDKILVQTGAIFNVSCKMGSKMAKKSSKKVVNAQPVS